MNTDSLGISYCGISKTTKKTVWKLAYLPGGPFHVSDLAGQINILDIYFTNLS